jgi:hypothetical protein
MSSGSWSSTGITGAKLGYENRGSRLLVPPGTIAERRAETHL